MRERRDAPGVTVVLLALGLAAVGPAVVGTVQPAAAAGSVVAKACADAPEPASPLAGLAGKFYGKPSTASDADPFTKSDVKIADVYGYSYRWVNFDNGCIPGSDALPAAQTAMGNFLMAGSAAVGAFTHGLFSLAVTPDFMAPLDDVLTTATAAIKGGFWDPWVTAILILVVAGILLAASRADAPHAVTTIRWALLVLVGATYVMSYPVASARAVDELVQTTIATSARGVGVANAAYGPPVPDNEGRESANEAQGALDDMFDTINRDLFYDAWLNGTLGASDTAIAHRYGPALFKASHLTWSEAETVRADPDASREIIEAKKDLWVQTAAAVEREDSAAYQQLTGNQGRWDAAGTVALRVALMLPFLAVAAVFIVVAYVATRVFVPLAPAFGVLGLLYVAQDWVVAVLKQVGRFVILGPAFFVAALANLLLATAVLDSDLAFGLKLVIVAGIPFVLFKLLRPGRAIPGSRAARRMARGGMGALVTALAAKNGAHAGAQAVRKNQDVDEGESINLRRDPAPYRYAYPKNAPVAMGELERGSDGRGLPPGQLASRRLGLPGATTTSRGQHVNTRDNGSRPAATGTRWHELPRRTRRELAAAGGVPSTATGSLPGGNGPRPGRDGRLSHTAQAFENYRRSRVPDVERPRETPTTRNHPPVRPEEHDADLSRPVSKDVPHGEVIGHESELPRDVFEATTSYDDDGNPVFEIWRPPTTSRPTRDDGEENR